MLEPLPDRIERAADAAARRYHRLVLLVGAARQGKTAALRALSERPGYRYVNIGVELGMLLLDLSERQRRLQVAQLLSVVCKAETGANVTLLDNIEILFSRALDQRPLRLLEQVSRNGTVVAAWRGAVVNGALCYASPGHSEYRSEPVGNHLIVSTDASVTT